ncbi:MAG: peptidylprolyl isomerase [Candidatus Omnitrophota bacterium]|nr:peptidylprolyl isomerase [Candidatus Omnitrophota bacterium]
MRFKKVLIITMILGFIFSTSYALAKSKKYVAKVNGVGIKAVMLEAALNNFVANQKLFGITVGPEEEATLRKDILEELISAELLYQESQKAKLGDLSQDIEDQFNGLKQGFGSEEDFNKVLKERSIKERDLKEDVKRGVYIKTFLEEKVYTPSSITEEAKRSEYEKNKASLNIPEQVRAAHILILVAADATDEDKKAAKTKINEVRKKALSGEDFAELAKENSQDGSAPTGGDLGYFAKGDMVKPFEDAAFSLKVDEISKVVETRFGYHIIKLLEKQVAHTLSYEEVERDIEGFLVSQGQREQLDQYINELKSGAKIEKLLD